MRKQVVRGSRRGQGVPLPPTPDAAGQTFGTAQTVDWITGHTTHDRTITSAIPPGFDRYATFVEFDTDDDLDLVAQESALVRQLITSGPRVWWLGYLDTGAHDVVFPSATKVTMYAHWPYVIVKGGPEQALEWRGGLPDVIFPEDHSWLVSMLWDDGWTCVGGPRALVDALVDDPLVQARAVALGEDI